MSGAGVVLLVDNDPGTRRALRSGLTDMLSPVEVLAAGNPRVATSVLDERPVDVLVIDLSMPMLDGYFLLATVSRRFPGMPVIAISDLATPDADAGLSGRLRVLPVPTNHEQVAAVVTEALERVAGCGAEGISLSEILLLAAAERRSCTMLVASGRRKGRLYLDDGSLVNAFSEDFAANGEAAARDILGWEDAAIEVEPLPEDVPSIIETPLRQMLDAAAASRSEAQARTDRAVPPADVVDHTIDEEVVMPFDDDAPIHPTELDLEVDAESAGADEAAAAAAASVSTEAESAEASRLDGSSGEVAADEAVSVAETSADGLEAQPLPVGWSEPTPVMPPTDGLEPHVALLAAAMERLSQRVQAADAALAAVGEEVVAFREARRHVEEVAEARERRLRELEAFREEVSRLAREILGRVDGLFQQEAALQQVPSVGALEEDRPRA